jgi:hypothetical protein
MLNNTNGKTQSSSGISHANREIEEIGVAWVNTSQKGTKYLRGYLNDGRQFLLFEQTNKPTESAPDYTLHVATYTDEEREILLKDAQERQAQREAKAAQYQQQQAQQAQTQQSVAQPQAKPQTNLPV